MSPDGAVWTDGPCHFAHWTRYLAAFDHVNVVARMSLVKTPADRLLRADGHGISFSSLPFYSGAAQYVARSRQVTQTACRAIAPDDAVILNAPSRIACCMQSCLKADRPYGVQVLGDPQDVFAPGIVKHPLRPVLRWWCASQLRSQAEHAAAALYVTQQRLQQRYPCPVEMFGVSDVDLSPDAYRPPRITRDSSTDSFTLVSVGTMSQLYKGFDTLIDALAVLRDSGVRPRLVLVGDGRYRALLESRVRRLRLESQVLFRGQIPAGVKVREELDAADLFVLPSRTEGLPRALIEAMARGLPCLASRVGGIPELLIEDDLTPPGDHVRLANAIRLVLANAERRRQMADRNYLKAREFNEASLCSRRIEFYQRVAQRTSDWRRARLEAAEPVGHVACRASATSAGVTS
jgi:glycosyltransferase involved in cell wall biosynthesis